MDKHARILVLGGRTGMVGQAIFRALEAEGFDNIYTPARDDLNLAHWDATFRYFQKYDPEYVFLAAAKVGGIFANQNAPAEFIQENLVIQTNVIHSARIVTGQTRRLKKFIFLGSSCIYPAAAPQPIKEESLLTGPLEETNRAYAVAKIAGLEMIRAYRMQYGFPGISLMPANLYGPCDNFSLRDGHVLPALLRKIHEAKVANSPVVELWGTGTPRREFLFVDDLAEACVFAAREYDGILPLNVGSGEDIKILNLGFLLAEAIGWKGMFHADPTKPDGPDQKLLDVSRMKALGWQAKIALRDGIRKTYAWYLANRS